MRFRSVLQEFEAHFHPVEPGSNVRGKSEWKHYGDGTYRFKISLRDIPLPDNSEINLWGDGHWMLRLPVKNIRARVDIENDSGSGIPAIKAGQVLQVKSGETVLAEGRYNAE
ncbi:MAG TPA: hypothetical protein VFH34_00090 [Anaerolineales bacterium]|nr:hypothetical protein [Anaerolineales bacterium]